uniref:Reverse transcriptase Ty1/copia-type domain-containing protein n=1 Tax=Tanacetum cinerariifolium TaxID=118510 RepID=A0A6L2KP67_TANCI|nr:hypothetical protein [Tanacetum cinerariifolium]
MLIVNIVIHAVMFLLASIVSAASSVPAASVLVLAVVSIDSAATSPLPPVHSLGSCTHTTRFPSPSDLGNHQHTAGIFSSSSYDDDFCADVTNLDSTVDVDLVATRRINFIHPQSQILGDLQSPTAIGTKWILKNKRDVRGIVVQNKARLVAQGHSAFLYEEIEKEVYVTQPKGFEDPYNPKHVYRVVKALYGLHQAPRAWHIILVQVYVDDIIFGSTNKAWCDEFEVLMKGEFEMSAMGELTFFLGLQVKQLPGGIFIIQDKYVKDMLKNFDMESVRITTTPYEVPHHKSKDEPDDAVNCKKQTVLATSSIEAEYVAAASCCGQDAYEKHLIQVVKIHTGENVADFLTKAFDGPWFHYLIVHIGMLNPYFLVHADEFVSAGGCTLPAGSYSFLQLDWFLLVVDDHNKVSYLEKVKGWEAYAQILDFLNRSHIRYALTHRPPMVFDSLVKQFWATATVRTLEVGLSDIIATIDGNEVVVTESLIRTQLQLDDVHGLYDFTLNDVLDGMRAIGYPTDGSLTFYKAKLSPQWRFIMDGMLGNVGSKRLKFLMYPRFLQMILGIQTTDPSPRPTFNFTAKLFSNMKLNWDGPQMPLLAPMLVVPAGGDAAGATTNVAAGLGPSSAPQVPPEREHSPVREPTPVREPSPRPKPKPTPDSPRPPSPLPSSAEVGPTTSSRPPSPSCPPSGPADSREGGGNFASSLSSNEAPQTPATTAAGGAEDSAALTALTLKLDEWLHRVSTLETELGITKKVLGGAVLKLVTRVKWLEGLLQQRKRRLVLSNSEGDDATTKEQEFDLAALHTLASMTLGDNPFATAAGPDVDSTMPVEPDAAVCAAIAPSSSIPTAADKGKAPMVDDSPPADLLSEQECADWLDMLAKIATNSALSKQLLSDDVIEENMNERLGMLLMRKRRELAEQSRVKPMTKTQQRDYMRDFVKNCSAAVYNQGWTMKKVKTLRIDQLRLEFEYIQKNLERSNLLNFRRSTFHHKPTLDAPPAKRASQGAPQVPAVSTHDPAGVPTAPSILTDALLPIASLSDPAAIPVPAVSIAHAAVFVPAEPMVDPAESPMDPPLTSPAHGSSELTVASLDDADALHFWRTQDSWRIRSWRTLERMLKHGLEVSKLLVGGDLTMAEQLIGFIKAALLNAKSAA